MDLTTEAHRKGRFFTSSTRNHETQTRAALDQFPAGTNLPSFQAC